MPRSLPPGRLGDRAVGRAVRWAGWAAVRGSAGRRAFTLPPSGPAAAVHLTTVIRLPPEVASALAPALERLRAQGPAHHYYPPAALHVTVLNLDGLAVDGGPAGGPAAVRALVAARRPFRLALRGLGVAPGTVYAQAFPADPTLRSLRDGLRELRPGGSAPRHRPGRGLGHANLVRFSGPVTTPFLDELVSLRRREWGSFTVHQLELVRTDRFLSPEGTTVLETIRLAGR